MDEVRNDSIVFGCHSSLLSSVEQQRHNITLTVRRFEQPRTGERTACLLLEILNEWKLQHHKVFRCLTDNGSNMVKAFKILQHDENAEESNSEESQSGTEDLVDADNESNDSHDDSKDDANFEEASVIATDEIQQ